LMLLSSLFPIGLISGDDDGKGTGVSDGMGVEKRAVVGCGVENCAMPPMGLELGLGVLTVIGLDVGVGMGEGVSGGCAELVATGGRVNWGVGVGVASGWAVAEASGDAITGMISRSGMTNGSGVAVAVGVGVISADPLASISWAKILLVPDP